MNDLEKYFFLVSENPIHKWVHYFEIYDRYFSKFRNRPINMLEIGVQNGGSLKMWKNYFHADSQIIGIDIDPECKKHEDRGIDIKIGSQNDKLFIDSLIETYKNFDIIIDDGSHISEHQINTFKWLFPHVNNHGVYLIEDTHTSYWDNWLGGYKLDGTCIEFTKNLIDDINAYFSKTDQLKPTYYTNNIGGIHYHDSIIVLDKLIRRYTPYDIIQHRGQTIGRETINKKIKI